MNPHIAIIGAGGVASYLLPVLIKAFKPRAITIYDKDVLEERNLDRQLFAKEQIGMPKAEAIARMVDPHGDHSIKVVPDWFTESTQLPDDTDFIVCVADNHEARHAAIQAAYRMGINAYVGGNEYFDHEAFVAIPELSGTKADPLVRYPNIATDLRGSPINCQGVEQEAHPQLAIANFGCAAKLLHLIHAHEVIGRTQDPEARVFLPIEIATGLFDTTTLTTKQTNE